MASTRIFDAGRGFGSVTDLMTFADCSVAKRADQWWMFAGGLDKTSGELQLLSAYLPPGAPLAPHGWQITTDRTHRDRPAILAGKQKSHAWDGKGGRHCPAYVKGYDPGRGEQVERIYYAGAAEGYLGPYGIGYVEWDGTAWVDQPQPVFTASESWERGSVYEPNLIYHDGWWKMWYVAGSNEDDYLVHGYAQSPNGVSDWSTHQVFAAEEHKVFDFCVVETVSGYEAVFSRVNLRGRADLPDAGLWWCRADSPSGTMSGWSAPVRIADAGPWKPSFQYAEPGSRRGFVFCNNVYPNTSGHGIPFHFTIDCFEFDRPDAP